MLCHSIPHISQYLKQELWSDSSISRNQKLWSDSSISPLPTHGHGECWTVQHSRTVCTYEIISFKYIYTLHVFHWLWTVHNQPEFSTHVDSVLYIYTLHVFYWLWTVHNQSEFSIHADTGVSCRSDERRALPAPLIVLDIIVCNIASKWFTDKQLAKCVSE